MARPWLLCLLVVSASAQPLLYYRGGVNAASFMPQGLPGGGIAQGSLFSLFGRRLGPTTPAGQLAFPLATTIGGASITVTQGSTTVHAIPLYVSQSQINAIMPSEAPLGWASVRVTVNGIASNPLPVRIVTDAFGIFTVSGAGIGPAVAQNYISPATQPVNSPTLSAAPGQVLTLWGTGLGPVTGGDNVAPAAGNLPTTVAVFVGGQPATAISYHGRAPCCAGVDQIDFQVPANAPLGCWVPVYVQTSGSTVSNFATIAVQKGGAPCSDPGNPFSAPIVSGGRAGAFVAVRATTREDLGTVAPVDVATDFQASSFYSQAPSPFPFNSGLSLPPFGTCTEYAVKGDLLNGDLLPLLSPTGTSLDAGDRVILTGPNGSAPAALTTPSWLPQFLLGYFGGAIGSTTWSGALALNPGTYTLSSSGGRDVGPFQATWHVPSPISWTGRNSLVNVNRAQPLNISWSGGTSSDLVGIVGFGEDLPTNSSTMFVCLASPGATSFSIPPPVLANLPPTRQNPLQSKDVIYLVSVPGAAAVPVNPTGVNAAAALFTYINGKTVIYQ
jgi:uncharacterized protein (TIGR03437 family)